MSEARFTFKEIDILKSTLKWDIFTTTRRIERPYRELSEQELEKEKKHLDNISTLLRKIDNMRIGFKITE